MTSTASEKVRWTTADLELFPDDGKRYEIIDGELFVTVGSVLTPDRVISLERATLSPK